MATTTKYSHAFLVGSFNGELKPEMLDKDSQNWTKEIIPISPQEDEKRYARDKGYNGLYTLYYKAHLDAMLEAQDVKRPKFLNSVHHYIHEIKNNNRNNQKENLITLSLKKGRFPNLIPYEYKFKLCRLHFYFFPLDIVLFAIEIDDKGTKLDDLTAAHSSLMEYWDADSFNNNKLADLMTPLTEHLDTNKSNRLTKDGNKLKIFQTVKIQTSKIEDDLLYEIGSSCPIGCIKSGNRPDMKPSETYFNKILNENSVSTFDNWKGLALVDSFTMLGKEDSFDENDCNFLYFPLIYLRCIFEKTFCFSRNNAYREDNADLKSLPQDIEQMEKYYFYDNISYNFQPNLIYQAMAKGLGIKEEREELSKQIKENTKKKMEAQKEKEEKRFNNILAGVSIFAVISVIWDFCSIVKDASGVDSNHNVPIFARIFIVIGIILIAILWFKIYKGKDHGKNQDNS